MKKLLIMTIVSLIVLSVTTTGFALGLDFGLKAGPSLAKYIGNDVSDDAERRIGFNAGLFIKVSFIDIMAVQPEVLFSLKGSRYEYSGVDGFRYENLYYIDIPVLFKYSLPIPFPIKPNVFFGPSLGINMIARYKNTDEVEDHLGSDKGDLDNIKSTDFGLVFGGGVDIGKLTADIRYSLGLTKLGDVSDPPAVRNGVLSLMVGYRLK